MAFIRLKNNRGRIVSARQGIAIWRIMQGEITGTKAQQRFCRNVRRVYLNPYTAPEAYKQSIAPPEPIGQTALPYKD